VTFMQESVHLHPRMKTEKRDTSVGSPAMARADSRNSSRLALSSLRCKAKLWKPQLQRKNRSPYKFSPLQRQKRLRFQTRNSTTIWYAPAMASSLMCSCTVTKLSQHFPIASPSGTNNEISWRRRGGGPRSDVVVLR